MKVKEQSNFKDLSAKLVVKNTLQIGRTTGVEIIFVSLDQTKMEMMDYMKEFHGDWFAIEHESPLAEKLKSNFQIKGIPYLGVLKTDGSIVSNNGQIAVEGQGLVPFLSPCGDWMCKGIPLRLTKIGNKIQ